MSDLTHKKIALAFAFFSFGVVLFGSIFTGSGIITAFIRGTEAAILFGLLAFGLGTMLVEKKDDIFDDAHGHVNKKHPDNTDTD